jgi:hypothetical protein
MCLVIALALLLPRLALLLMAVFTDWISAAFETTLWPVLGWFFMPYTTLAYMTAMLNNNHQLNGGWLALFIVAIIVDCGGHGSAAKTRRKAQS